MLLEARTLKPVLTKQVWTDDGNMLLISNLLTLYCSVIPHGTKLKSSDAGKSPPAHPFQFNIQLYVHNGKVDLKGWLESMGTWFLEASVLHRAYSVLSSQLPFIGNAGGRRIHISLGRRSFSSFPLHFSCLSMLTLQVWQPKLHCPKSDPWRSRKAFLLHWF